MSMPNYKNGVYSTCLEFLVLPLHVSYLIRLGFVTSDVYGGRSSLATYQSDSHPVSPNTQRLGQDSDTRGGITNALGTVTFLFYIILGRV